MSTKSVTYTLSLLDRISAPMSRLVGTSDTTIGKLAKLQEQSKTLKSATVDLGNSLGVLRDKMALLHAEKELINPKNLTDIKRYNREIQSLEKQIDKLDNAGRKKGFLGELKDSLGSLINPATIAVAAGGFILKDSMQLDEQFAKVNITARLEGGDFEKLKADIIGIAKKNKVDIGTAPGAFEQILSQTNDVNLSLSILDSTLKGAKAGFAGADVVASALAQTLSIVGKENTNAQEVLDTYFAAKRVGAGEFADFANYMPGLITGAKSIGIEYKEVAGIFSYMTGMGNKAAQADVLMNNMFSMLGRGEVVEKLKQAGVNVFDNGKIRSTVDIFRDMASVMSTMNDEQKSNFIEKIGVVDKEAKRSFMVMAEDVDKLSNSLKEVVNSTGEADRTLAFSGNSLQRAQELWASLKGQLLSFGTSILPVVNAGMAVLGFGLDVVGLILGGVSAVFGGWYDMLADGNPIIWALTAALGVAGTMLVANKIKLMAIAAWNGIVSLSTGLAAKAMVMFNAIMATSPIGWLLIGVGALVGGIVALCSRTDKATKSFAEFNSELSKTKAETKDNFAVAMQAADNTDTRKEAIRKLNEQYGEYLPNLLSEKASNDELTTALNSVNGQLERKLLNKFRDQALESALSAANEAKTEILNWMLDAVEPGQQKQLAADFNATWERISTGKSDWEQEEKFYQKKYDIGTGFFENLWGGGFSYGTNLSDWGVYSSVGGEMMDLQNVAADLYNQQQRINLLYDTTTPTATTTTTINNITYQSPLGNLPYLQNGASNDPAVPMFLTDPSVMVKAKEATPMEPSATITPSTNILDKKTPKTPGGVATPTTFDLDQIVTNEKGSTAYGAIVSKLNRVKVAGLAAASLASVIATPLAAAATPINDSMATNIAITGDQDEYDSQNRPLTADKFCDQIVIHIANADGRGEEEIRSAVVKVLGDITNSYNQH